MPVGPYPGPNSHTGNGVTTVFAYSFRILDAEDLEVYVDGVLQTLTTHYTVSGVGASGGGSIAFVSPPANLSAVVIARVRSYERDTDYQRAGAFDEESVDRDFDGLEMQIQQISADAVRTLKAPLSVTVDQVFSDADWAGRAGKYVRMKNDGSGPEFVEPVYSLGNFLASGVGAVARTASAKMADIISVKDFGAVGDGSTDDATALQAAITAVQGTSVTLYVPPGNYKTTAGLAATGATRILGAGRYGTSISWTDLTLNVLTFTTPNPCSVESLSFSGPASASSGSVLTFTASGAAENAFSLVRDCIFAQGRKHIVTTKASSLGIENCYFSAAAGNAVTIENQNNVDSGDSHISGCTFSGGAAGTTSIYHVSSGGLRVTNNKILGAAYGYRMVLASGAATGVLVISGNSFENQTAAAIAAATLGGGATYAGIVICGNHINNSPTPISFDDATAFLSRIRITGNDITLSSAGTVGITITNASDFLVEGNSITGTGGTPTGVSVGTSCTLGKVGVNKYTALTTNLDISSSAVSVEGPPPVLLASSGTPVAGAADTNENALATINIPAKQLGKHGSVRVRANFTVTNSANNKTIRVRYSAIGGTAMFSTVMTTTGKLVLDFVMRNAGATNSQLAHAVAVTDAPAVLAPADVTAAVDTTAGTTLVITGQKASAGETIQLQGYTCELFNSRT